ncbi:MAG TPA: hypothetical protein VK168_02000 [Saprospiraceae bacterium]|nr:hypothetical protein [Saprospiraceae bacterium]
MNKQAGPFKVIQSPHQSCLVVIIIMGLYFGIGGPIILTAAHFGGILGLLASFMIVAFGLSRIMLKYINAESSIQTNDSGLTIEVTRKGLGTPVGVTTYTWDQLDGYRYARVARSPNTLTLYWASGEKQVFQAFDTEFLYQHLCRWYPDRERDFWGRPKNE